MKKDNKKDNKTFYSLDMNNLNKVPSCDIFGYLMASVGVTSNTSEENVVRILYILKNKYSNFGLYISTILTNIIGYGDINDYMEHLTSKQNEFITSTGELVNVKNNLVF